MAECDDIKDAYDEAKRDYENAARTESAAEWSQWGQIGAAAGATGATVACWAALEEVTLGLATAACVAVTVGTLGEYAQVTGAWQAENQAEEAREAAEWWMDEMATVYCFCLENGGLSTPDPPDIQPAEPYDDEEWFDYPMDDEPDAGCCDE